MSRWTDWVKNWASENGLSYGCALSKPQCSAEYRMEYGLPLLEKHKAFQSKQKELETKKLRERERRKKLKDAGVYGIKQLK